jgi:RND family efflux transporter MFP subunit
MERVIVATGTLAAQEQSTLSAKVPGRLQRLAVDLGSVVREGDVLAQIEPRDYELRLQQSSTAVAQTRAALGLSLEGDNDQVDLEAVSSVKQAKAVLEEATKNRERIRSLFQAGIASPSELDSVEATYSVALARHETARDEARTRMAALAQRRAELEIARKQLADAIILAPFDGGITDRPANLGEYLATGTPIVRLVKIDPLRLRLEVPERESMGVRVGETVRLLLENSTNVFTGRITRLSPALDEQTRMLRVEADVPNDGTLRPGMFARAQIIIDEHDTGLSVPADALVTFAGIEKVILIQEGKAVENPVNSGRRGSNWVEIVSGLDEGGTVVLAPGGLRTGQPVTVRDQAGNPQTAKVNTKAGQ